MTDNQKTIKSSIALKGKGLHTGIEVELKINPAPVNHGYKFQRVDLEDKPIISAIAENVVDASRSTVIAEKGHKVGTIEHLLSALFGLGVDNALIEISGPEVPILDGSSKIFVEEILKVGIIDQQAMKEYFTIKTPIILKDDVKGAEIMMYPDDKFSVDIMINYDSTMLNNQYASIDEMENYATDIATCRTFVFMRDLEVLLKNNMIKGGDIDNAIVIVDREISQDEFDHLADLFNIPRMAVQPTGVLNNISLQFSNEAARHKLLDLIGDFALVGQPIKGKIIARRTGHRTNTDFAKKLRQIIKTNKGDNLAPQYDPNLAPLFDINEVRKILPHRPPFLLIDKILEMNQTTIIGVKNVTMNEPFFVGHFPNEPVMPGVLIVEAMAQCGGILVLKSYPDPENYITYFMKIDKVKFRGKVVPGDTVIFRLELMEPIRRGIANMRGLTFVGNKLVAEGEFVALVTKDKNKQ